MTTGARVGVNMVEIVSQTVVKPIDAVAKCIREARLFDDTVTRRIRL